MLHATISIFYSFIFSLLEQHFFALSYKNYWQLYSKLVKFGTTSVKAWHLEIMVKSSGRCRVSFSVAHSLLYSYFWWRYYNSFNGKTIETSYHGDTDCKYFSQLLLIAFLYNCSRNMSHLHSFDFRVIINFISSPLLVL